MGVRPLRDRVLVKRIEAQAQKIGGIIIPDTAKEKPQQAEVIAASSGRVSDDGQTIPLELNSGRLSTFGFRQERLGAES
jgi:chaperonin GroES